MAKSRTGLDQFFHLRRIALGRKWKRILSDAYLSRATLHRIRHGDPYHPIAEVDSLRALANALDFNSWADLIAAFDQNDPKAGLDKPRPSYPILPRAYEEPREDAVVTLSKALNLTPTELVQRLGVGALSSHIPPAAGGANFPGGLRISEIRPARLAPHFVSGVAASKRVEKLEEEDHESRQPVATDDLRVFTIPVDGDCQAPVWNDGDIVVFSFDAFDREGIQSGKSYYLAFTDGSTTFKRVFVDESEPDVYILRCWNTAKFPAERRVHFSEVVRIAKAIAKQVTPEQ